MKTAVVILNWNTKDFLRRFLPEVLASAEGRDAEVIVADSASTDGSMELMERDFPRVRTIRLDRNYGFTGGYNRALGRLKDEGFSYYVLLNTDIEVSPDWLEPLTGWMEDHPDCGACAPKLHSLYQREMFEYAGAAGGYLDSYGFPFCRGRVLKMVEKDEGQYDSPKEVLWCTGACLMVRAGLWHEYGGLDDRFFAHMEEIDLCWRLQLGGWKVCTVPQSVVYHLGGGTLPQSSPWKLRLNYRNNLLLLENNLAKTYALRLFCGFDKDSAYALKAAKKACRIARATIFKRMVIDGTAAAAYLLTGKPRYFAAVIKGHREYRRLRRKESPEEVAAYLHANAGAEVSGLCGFWIVPRAVFGGRRVFGLVHKLG